MTDKKRILNHQEIKRKLKRISYQILEANIDENTILIAGVQNNGYKIAELIADYLKEISDLDIIIGEIKINKKSPINSVSCNIEENLYQNTSVVVVDDVLNSGSTLIYAVNYFLKTKLKQLKTVVLVDRSHKKFPINADYKGLSLSTTMKSHIEVVLDANQEFNAYLMN